MNCCFAVLSKAISITLWVCTFVLYLVASYELLWRQSGHTASLLVRMKAFEIRHPKSASFWNSGMLDTSHICSFFFFVIKLLFARKCVLHRERMLCRQGHHRCRTHQERSSLFCSSFFSLNWSWLHALLWMITWSMSGFVQFGFGLWLNDKMACGLALYLVASLSCTCYLLRFFALLQTSSDLLGP